MQTDLTPQSCPTCGHLMQLKFCPNCGEKRVNKHDFTLKHFAEEALEGFTHFDNKFLRTIKKLMFKPGQLAEDFSNGIRSRYMRPLQLYLVCNLFFFLLAILSNPFSQPMGVYWSYKPYTSFHSQEIIGKKVAKIKREYVERYGETEEHAKDLSNQYFYSLLETKFNQAIKSQSKIFLIVLIPIYALFFILFFRRKRFVGEHLILATHFMSALLVYYLIIGNTVNAAISYATNDNQTYTSILGMLFISIYLTFAFKRFYSTPLWKSLLAGFTIGALTIFVWTAYRMLLFYNIMLWT